MVQPSTRNQRPALSTHKTPEIHIEYHPGKEFVKLAECGDLSSSASAVDCFPLQAGEHGLRQQQVPVPSISTDSHRIDWTALMHKKELIVYAALGFGVLAVGAYGQTSTAPDGAARDKVNKDLELFTSQVEEIAMCNHAIKAARHMSLSLSDDPADRYAAMTSGHTAVYPDPEECSSVEQIWITSYIAASDHGRSSLEKMLSNVAGMTAKDVAVDGEFFSAVVSKKTINGR